MDIEVLIKKVIKFRDARNWKQFHNPKDSAIALQSEATEVLEQFKWQNEKEMEEHVKTHKEDLGDELSDVLYWVLLMGYDFKIDLIKAFNRKMKKNEKNYPVVKSKGRHAKYTNL
jgi:NTP pyrophosphatase (non-canonical NTP hydrolase)